MTRFGDVTLEKDNDNFHFIYFHEVVFDAIFLYCTLPAFNMEPGPGEAMGNMEVRHGWPP